MKNLTLLGSTGSIGTNTLDVLSKYRDRYRIAALVAGSNVDLLVRQVSDWKPEQVVLPQEETAIRLRNKLGGAKSKILWGEDAMVEAATLPEVEIVVSAIVGTAGLKPTYAALKAGKKVALANKESLVAAGGVMTKALQEGGGSLIPIDSEHSAIHQVLRGEEREVVRLILTASGGPFRTLSKEALEKVTVEEALRHPNWSMGDKITIDSATMMNKGLEIIEAHWLFQMPPHKIAVTLHPQSIIHSLVEYVDGSILAQMGLPDMRTPIAYALSYPERMATKVPRLNLVQNSPLTFEEPDLERFPCLALAKNALEMGESAPCVLNAANEVAVAAFLKKQISFLDIPRLVEKVLSRHQTSPLNSLEDVVDIDREARERAKTFL